MAVRFWTLGEGDGAFGASRRGPSYSGRQRPLPAASLAYWTVWLVV